MANWIKNLVAKALDNPRAGAEPLVITRAILDAVDERVKVLSGGRSIFPFSQLTVQFLAASAEDRAIIVAGFAENNELQRLIRQHLERRNIEGAAAIRVTVDILESAAPDWAERGFNLIYGHDSAATQRIGQPSLTILLGRASQMAYPLKDKHRIGRGEEAQDRYGRLVRRNDIIFEDNQDEVNRSVSRIQARIEYDDAKGGYVLYDDNSTQGTFIERDGRMLTVAGQRGIALKDGDVIYFGKARAAFGRKGDSG